MFSSLKKKTKALGIWHSKAMLVDPKKTKITIVGSETADLFEEGAIRTRFLFQIPLERKT